MLPAEITQLRRIYAEICRGYSESEWNGKVVYVKHLTAFGQTEIEVFQEKAVEDALKRGILSEEERIKWLIAKGLWSTKEDADITAEKSFVENLEKTLSIAALEIQRKQLRGQLKEGKERLDKLLEKKSQVIGLTAERVAEQRTQYEHVRLSFFWDVEMTTPIFTKDDIEQLSDGDSMTILVRYIDIINRFSATNLRKIAIQPFFTNYFHLCAEDIRSFFGKPIVELTSSQANLLAYGQYFRSIFTHNDIPKEIETNPDKIEDFVTKTKNMKEMMSHVKEQKGGRVGYVGASKEDFDAMGAEDGTESMRNAAKRGYTDARSAAKDMGFSYSDGAD